MKREGLKKGIFILPNLFTTANMFCGFFAMLQVFKGDYLLASWVLFLAGLFDFLDGRVARMTKSQSEFGLEFDSLSDLTSFGIAPALLIYQWSLFQFGRLGWAVAFLYFACGALRLARFNVQAMSVERKDFQGLPIPSAAACPVSFVILHHHLFGPGQPASYFVLLITFLVAILMVSNIRYRSFKALDRSRRGNFFLLVLLVGIIFIVASAPNVILFVIAMTYLATGIIGEILKSHQRIRSVGEFFSRFFHAHPREWMIDDRDEADSRGDLRVVHSDADAPKQSREDQ